MVAMYGEVNLDWGVADKVKDVIADADEGRPEDCCRWNRKHADGKEVDGNSIVIKADKGTDRNWFLFLCLLESDLYKSHVFP
jgi:hypothetical protein